MPATVPQDAYGLLHEGGSMDGSPISHFSKEYLEAGWRRTSLVTKAVYWGFNVLVTDVDIIWFKNPYSYLNSFPLVGLLVSCSAACCHEYLVSMFPRTVQGST